MKAVARAVPFGEAFAAMFAKLNSLAAKKRYLFHVETVTVGFLLLAIEISISACK